jgi:uncharacterized membrane protein YkvA (DUF1232 family)
MSKSASWTGEDFYHKLRRTVQVWAGGEKGQANKYLDLILAGPDLYALLTRLAGDQRVSSADRRRLAAAAVYFVNPLDLVPEMVVGPAGLVDDVVLAALVLHDLLERLDPAIVREHWEGSVDVLDLVRRVLAVADTMLGGPVWRRLQAMARELASRGS